MPIIKYCVVFDDIDSRNRTTEWFDVLREAIEHFDKIKLKNRKDEKRIEFYSDGRFIEILEMEFIL